MHGEFTLIYAGRISEDKNLTLLVKLFELANLRKPGQYNLIIAGDGPYLHTLKQLLTKQNNVLFTGRLAAKELVTYYQNSDLLIFPSHTDTFGMVVLEAQACGLPCLVTASGGPKEIIEVGKTGQVIHNNNEEDWFAATEEYVQLKRARPDQYIALRSECSKWVNSQNSWQNIFEQVLGKECKILDDSNNENVISMPDKNANNLDRIA